jgi:hypothetical protein
MKQDNKIVRPMAVTVTSYLVFAWGVGIIIYSFTGIYGQYGNLFPALNALCIIGLFASIAGVLNMEKWGLRLFALMMVLKWGVGYYYGAFGFWEILLVIPLIIFWSYRKFFK